MWSKPRYFSPRNAFLTSTLSPTLDFIMTADDIFSVIWHLLYFDINFIKRMCDVIRTYFELILIEFSLYFDCNICCIILTYFRHIVLYSELLLLGCIPYFFLQFHEPILVLLMLSLTSLKWIYFGYILSLFSQCFDPIFDLDLTLISLLTYCIFDWCFLELNLLYLHFE